MKTYLRQIRPRNEAGSRNQKEYKKMPPLLVVACASRGCPDKPLEDNKKIEIVSKATGLLPNAATTDTWKKVFTKEDETYFIEQIANASLKSRYFG